MPLQNRGTPLGEVVADRGRGLVYANRGCLVDASGQIVRRFNGKRWIACRLEFKGRRRHPLMQPGRYTELFFLDEATAFAAGHRPCAECRRGDYERFLALWRLERPHARGADDMDKQLHAERLDFSTRTQRHHAESWRALPNGAFVLYMGAPRAVFGSRLLRWTPAGYVDTVARPARGHAVVVTPVSLVEVLRRGWSGAVPLLHPSSSSI
jgi:hypothetical protein